MTQRKAATFLFLGLWLTAGIAVAEATPGDEDAEPARHDVTVSAQVGEKLIVANDLLEDEKYDVALKLVDALAKKRRLTPADLAQIHRFRGYILVSKGTPEAAAEDFEKSLAENALDESAERGMIYSLAQIYTQLGRYDRALELVDRWFETTTEPTPEAHYLKAMILMQQEDFEAALEPAKTAIAMSPEPRESWLQLLAAIHFQLEDYAGVADTLERLIAIRPDSKRYWVQLATVENTLGRDAKALATLRLAHESDLLNEDRELRQLARFLLVRDLPYECARVLEEGMAGGVVARDAESYELVASCYITARENERALDPLAKAGELASDAQSFMLLGQLHLQSDRHELALDVLRKAATKASSEQRGPVQLLIGVAELGADRYDEAEQAFRAALGDDKVRAAAESYLAFLEEQRSRAEHRPEPAQVASQS